MAQENNESLPCFWQQFTRIMNILKLSILIVAILSSLIAGFFCSYFITIWVIVLVIVFNILNLIVKYKKTSLKLLFSVVSFLGILLFFHFGILIRSNFRQVCFYSQIKNDAKSKYNTYPVSTSILEKKIILDDDFKTDTLRSITFNKKDFFIKRISSKEKKDKIKILIVAGMHGTETASIHAVTKIFDKIKFQNLSKQFYFEIVYTLNPVGVSLFNRNNECNCDINRDFKLFKTVQSTLLRNLVNKEKFDFVLDLHEGPYDGHYFINNTSIKNLSSSIKNTFDQEKIKKSPLLENKLKDFLFRYELDNFIVELNNIMTFDSYLKSINVQNILSESDGLNKDLNKRIEGHLIVFDKLIDGVKK